MIECLLIDDDLDDQEIFKLCVEKLSNTVNFTGITDSVEAVSSLTANSGYTPNYIFLDMNMPKMNGMQCLASLRKIQRLNQSKIYMYSTTSEDTMVSKSKALGADNFIVKPARMVELKEKLIKLFELTENN